MRMIGRRHSLSLTAGCDSHSRRNLKYSGTEHLELYQLHMSLTGPVGPDIYRLHLHQPVHFAVLDEKLMGSPRARVKHFPKEEKLGGEAGFPGL